MDDNGNSIVTIFGQEKDHATAGLAKMNLILHQKGTGEIKRGNTLVDPAFTDDFDELKKFEIFLRTLIQCPVHGSVENGLKQRLSADLNVLPKA